MKKRITWIIEDGETVAISATDDSGRNPLPVTAEDIADEINEANALRVASINDEIETLNSDHEAALQSLRDQHAEEIAALKGQAPPSTQQTINALSTAFREKIPAEFQSSPVLLQVFATVRVLIEAGEPEMAKAFILNAEVPEELEALKPAFAAMIPTE